MQADRADELVTAFRGRSHLVEASDGFVDLQVWRSDRDPEEVWMVSRWRERDCFTAYMRSEEHAASHARIPQDLDEAITLERTTTSTCSPGRLTRCAVAGTPPGPPSTPPRGGGRPSGMLGRPDVQPAMADHRERTRWPAEPRVGLRTGGGSASP